MQIQLPHNEILRYMFFSLRLQEDNTGLMKSIPHSSCQQSQSIAALVADSYVLSESIISCDSKTDLHVFLTCSRRTMHYWE